MTFATKQNVVYQSVMIVGGLLSLVLYGETAGTC